MDPLVTLALSVSGVVVGAKTLKSTRAYLDCRPARRALVAAPPFTSSSGEGEIVRVTGVVVAADTTIDAALTGRPCVVSRARVRILQEGVFGFGAQPYVTFAMVPFAVDVSQIGRVRIEGRFALLDVPSRAMSKRRCIRGSWESLLEEHHISEGPRVTPRFDECTVEIGTRVSVSGVLMREAARVPNPGEQGYRDSAPPTIVLQGTVSRPLAIGRPVE